jgi:Tim17/Tim22/Tim23/Pmp24 family
VTTKFTYTVIRNTFYTNHKLECRGYLLHFDAMPPRRLSLATMMAMFVVCSTVDASAVLFSTRHAPTTSDTHFPSSRSRRSSLFPGTSFRMVSVVDRSQVKKGSAWKGSTNEPAVLQGEPDISFDDLGLVGKVVASATELAVTVVWNYCQGYLTGFFFGTLIGIPGFLFRPVEKGVPQPFMTEVSARFARMNTRSLSFGKQFGGISAIFKGSDTAIQRLRYGKNDEWNDILGSALAGAIFGRQGEFDNGVDCDL